MEVTVSGPPQVVAPPPQGMGALLDTMKTAEETAEVCPSCRLPKLSGLGAMIKLNVGSVLLTALALSATVGNPVIKGLVTTVSVAEYKPLGPPAGAANSACTTQDAPAATVNGGALGQVTWLMVKSAALVPETVSAVT